MIETQVIKGRTKSTMYSCFYVKDAAACQYMVNYIDENWTSEQKDKVVDNIQYLMSKKSVEYPMSLKDLIFYTFDFVIICISVLLVKNKIQLIKVPYIIADSIY